MTLVFVFFMMIVITELLKIKVIAITRNKVNNLFDNFISNTNSSINYGNVITYQTSSSLPFDYSWYDYLKQVYGDDFNLSSYESINKSSILFIYKFAKVKVIELYKSESSLVKTHLSRSADKYRISYMHNSSFIDNTWIEVSRFSTSYLNLGWNEGYSTGIYNASIKTEKYVMGNNDLVPYGCYFNSAPGSGIYINTKKIYMERNDISLSKQFPHTFVNDKNSCINNDKSIQCGDKYMCTLVLNEGYYSKYNNIGIKLWKNNKTKFRNDQFVICGGNCATQELSTTCPLIELRMGYQANQLCQCSNKSPILNCGKYVDVGEMFGVIPSSHVNSIGATTSTTTSYHNDIYYHSNDKSSRSSSTHTSDDNSNSKNSDSNDTYHDDKRFQPFTCISRRSNSNNKSNTNTQIMFINDHLFNSNFHKYSSLYLQNNNQNIKNNTFFPIINEYYYVITFDIKFQTQNTPSIIPTTTTTDNPTTTSFRKIMMINIKVYQYNRKRGKFIYFLTSPMNLYNLFSAATLSTSSNIGRIDHTKDNINNIPNFDSQDMFKYDLSDLVFLQSFLFKNNYDNHPHDDSKNDNSHDHKNHDHSKNDKSHDHNNHDHSKKDNNNNNHDYSKNDNDKNDDNKNDDNNNNNNIHQGDNNTSSMIGIISFNTNGQDHEVINDNPMKIIHLIRNESMCLLTADAKIIILIIIGYNHHQIKINNNNNNYNNYNMDYTQNDDNDNNIELELFLNKCINELLKKGYVHIILLVNKNNNININNGDDNNSSNNRESGSKISNNSSARRKSNHSNQNVSNNYNNSYSHILLQQQQQQQQQEQYAHHNYHNIDISKGFQMLSLLYKEQNLKLSYHIDSYDV